MRSTWDGAMIDGSEVRNCISKDTPFLFQFIIQFHLSLKPHLSSGIHICSITQPPSNVEQAFRELLVSSDGLRAYIYSAMS